MTSLPGTGNATSSSPSLFPGEVTSHNGESSGQRVEWKGDWDDTLDMRATAMAEPDAPPAWAWMVGGLTLLLLVGTVVLLVARGRRLSSASAPPAARDITDPPGADPAPTPPLPAD